MRPKVSVWARWPLASLSKAVGLVVRFRICLERVYETQTTSDVSTVKCS